ncbi:PIN domain-containing protein [Paenibacillus koleovorans]|uniref:PIN domain-containing protein n=1 Tax=Paenibacillus koleovorans TaxID=121608 RepID=UPI000FDA61F8|nr:PIN domain-containing protein [Paenibacillus koleovorans]
MSVLLDTNILVYAWDPSDPQKQARAVQTLHEYRHQACLSTQNVSEFASVMIRKGCDLGWLSRVITLYSQIMTVYPVSVGQVEHALRAVREHRMSFWDAQIWAVAMTHRIPVILTEDGPVGQTIEGVQFHNPLQ